MKDYLNNAEIKELVILAQSKNLMKHFIDGNMMTKTEKANLKRSGTFLKNTILSLLTRLGEKEAKKFVRVNDGSRVLCITNSELEVLQKRKLADLNAAYEDNKEYFELIELVMDQNCKDCKKHFKDCNLFRHMDQQEIIPFSEIDYGSCKFSYSLDIKV